MGKHILIFLIMTAAMLWGAAGFAEEIDCTQDRAEYAAAVAQLVSEKDQDTVAAAEAHGRSEILMIRLKEGASLPEGFRAEMSVIKCFHTRM